MITAALTMLAVAGACFVMRAVAGPSLADRIVALDALVVTIVAAMLVNGARTETTRFVDLALVVAFIGFVGATAAARFIERRGG